MLEMDRFVFSLSGDDKEVIERRSLDSAAAMKEQGLTLKRFMQDIIDNRETSTWCGFPQNLLVPRFHCYSLSLKKEIPLKFYPGPSDLLKETKFQMLNALFCLHL